MNDTDVAVLAEQFRGMQRELTRHEIETRRSIDEFHRKFDAYVEKREADDRWFRRILVGAVATGLVGLAFGVFSSGLSATFGGG